MDRRGHRGTWRGRRDEIFHGWYIVAACFVLCFVVFGISVNTFTVYVKPIEAEFGWSRKAISGAMSLGALSMALFAPFIGRLIDRLGAPRMMLAGTLVVGGTSVLVSWMSSLTYFYVMFVISGVGQGAATLIPISLVVANWFDVKRGLAMGIVMSGTGLGAMVMVPVTTLIVTHWGWRTSFRAMGLVILLVAVPVILLFIRTKPSEMGLRADGKVVDGDRHAIADAGGLTVSDALRTRTFWLIATMMFIFGLVGLGVGVHMMAYLTDLEYPQTTASLIVAVISAMTVGGKVGMGLITDRWGVQWAVLLTSALCMAGIGLLIVAKPLFVALVCAIVYGFAIGAPLMLNPTLTSKYLGLAHFGAIFGILSLVSTVGAAFGPVASGAVYDSVASYVPAYVLFVVLLGIAGLCGFMARAEFISEEPS